MGTQLPSVQIFDLNPHKIQVWGFSKLFLHSGSSFFFFFPPYALVRRKSQKWYPIWPIGCHLGWFLLSCLPPSRLTATDGTNVQEDESGLQTQLFEAWLEDKVRMWISLLPFAVNS